VLVVSGLHFGAAEATAARAPRRTNVLESMLAASKASELTLVSFVGWLVAKRRHSKQIKGV
jgi:hypothetical protein